MRNSALTASYLNIGGTFYSLCSTLDGFRRYIVNWDIWESLTEAVIEGKCIRLGTPVSLSDALRLEGCGIEIRAGLLGLPARTLASLNTRLRNTLQEKRADWLPTRNLHPRRKDIDSRVGQRTRSQREHRDDGEARRTPRRSTLQKLKDALRAAARISHPGNCKPQPPIRKE